MSSAVVVATRELTDAVVAFVAAGTGKPVGDGAAPAAGLDETGYVAKDGYLVVYATPGGEFDGPPFHAPDSEGTVVYQVTSVARRRDQAEWLADRARLTFLSRAGVGFQVAFPSPAGWRVVHRAPDAGLPGVDGPTGSAERPVFTVAERFRLTIVPD